MPGGKPETVAPVTTTLPVYTIFIIGEFKQTFWLSVPVGDVKLIVASGLTITTTFCGLPVHEPELVV